LDLGRIFAWPRFDDGEVVVDDGLASMVDLMWESLFGAMKLLILVDVFGEVALMVREGFGNGDGLVWAEVFVGVALLVLGFGLMSVYLRSRLDRGYFCLLTDRWPDSFFEG
jgi:hypothetical protein